MQKTHQLHPSRLPKPPPTHRLQGGGGVADSDELDVFEATRYFSGGADGEGRRAMRGREERAGSWSAGRRSLDTLKAKLPYQQSKKVAVFDQISSAAVKDKSGGKQPNSPGGKLASFLNSLFKQAIYRKRSLTEKDGYGEEAPHAGRRRRRSSISFFQTARGGGRPDVTPPPGGGGGGGWYYDKRKEECWRTERAKSVGGRPEDGIVVSDGDGAGSHGQESQVLWSRRKDLAEKDETLLSIRKEEEEEGYESDSSSDLFELKSFDLASELPACDLPVYGSPILQS